MPAARKYKTAGVRKLDRVRKKVAKLHSAMADIPREINDAVMALDVTNPRRFKTLEKAKQREAKMAKNSDIVQLALGLGVFNLNSRATGFYLQLYFIP